MRLALIAVLTTLPLSAFAMGSSDTPPKKTKTVTECTGESVWSEEKQSCVPVKPKEDDEKSSHFTYDELYQAVRELAYAGRYIDAQGVLEAMSDQQDDRVLTYWGFTNRKLGNLEAAHMFYATAIDKNPDNLLARSYMAQGFVEQGNLDAAKMQLAEIEARGGSYTWPATSLRQAIYAGKIFDY